MNNSLAALLPATILNMNNLRESGVEVKPSSGEQDWLLGTFDFKKF